ncbi:MAG: sigma-70 family RNA polymerase sigma factor [Planctomycetes bacterium]|nr:sigma-70 family RNA polymerase sigma factor [Planctomycetota bacterium]
MDNGDARQVLLAREGDREAYRVLVAKYWRVLSALAYQTIGDREEAEDIAQEAFIRAFAALPRLKDPRKFFRWLLAILRRIALDRIRARRRRRAQSLDDLPEGVQPSIGSQDKAVDDRDAAAAALRAIGRLPERDRIVLTLRYLMDYEPHRIARILDEPDGTIRNRIFRALDRLRRLLDHG